MPWMIDPHKLTTSDLYPRSRLLKGDRNLVERTFPDPVNPARTWKVIGVYAPIAQLRIPGVRLRLEDQKGFTSFINQRDAEVLLHFATPGSPIGWMAGTYVHPSDPPSVFFGPCMDEYDVLDDLYSRECVLRSDRKRSNQSQVIPPGMELTRKLHNDRVDDYIERWRLHADTDPAGYTPDLDPARIEQRWQRTMRTPVDWSCVS